MIVKGLGLKLLLVIVLLTSGAVVITATFSYQNAKHTIQQQAHARLEALSQAQESVVSTYFESVENDLNLLALNAQTHEAIQTFAATYALFADPTEALQRAYITDNPNPQGEKDKLQKAATETPYDYMHGKHHAYFHQLQMRNGYYDVFLFDTNGNLIYSVFKETDFATNFLNGQWKDTNLANVYRQAMTLGPDDASAGSDLAPYGPSYDAPAVFIARPVFNKADERIGVVAYQLPTGQISAAVQNARGVGDTGEIFLVGQDGLMRTNPTSSTENEVLDTRVQNPAVDAAFAKKSGVGEFMDRNGEMAAWAVQPIEILGLSWALVIKEDTAELYEPLTDLKRAFLLGGAVLILMALGLSALFARTLITPINGLRSAMQSVADEDYDVEIPALNRRDEIGGMAQTLDGFRLSLKQAQHDASIRQQLEQTQKAVVDTLRNGLDRLAHGDLTVRIDDSFDANYEQLRHDFNQSIDSLEVAMRDVIENAELIARESAEISSAADDLSRRTEQQATTLEETAAALDETTKSVDASAKAATRVNGLSTKAREDAEASGQVMGKAVSAIEEIERSSQEIGKIISVIDDIAFQTNLLALNAGVEAARAGDTGRGFAVVAGEVRALANRSSDAAREIKDLIEASGQQVNIGVDLVGKAGTALAGIVESVKEVSGHIGEISDSTSDQSRGLSEINEAVGQLEVVTQKNAVMFEETTAASQALTAGANALHKTIQRFSVSAPDNGPSLTDTQGPAGEEISAQLRKTA